MAKPELRMCPFCNCKPKLRRIIEEYEADADGPAGEFENSVQVDCDECGYSISAEYRSEAVENWNRRASLPEEPR